MNKVINMMIFDIPIIMSSIKQKNWNYIIITTIYGQISFFFKSWSCPHHPSVHRTLVWYPFRACCMIHVASCANNIVEYLMKMMMKLAWILANETGMIEIVKSTFIFRIELLLPSIAHRQTKKERNCHSQL